MHLAQAEEQGHGQAADSVLAAPPEIDGRRFRRVDRRARDFANNHAIPNDLRQHLRIKGEVVDVPI